MSFSMTARQRQAQEVLAGPASHILLYGGSRSGKTLQILRTIAVRALKAPGSRHAVLRFRFNHLRASIISDTWPRMMELCCPGIKAPIDKSDWYAQFPNRSQVWFGGLDDKERTEKVLGQEHASIFLNECSQIPWASRNLAVTRLAQAVTQRIAGRAECPLQPRMYYDCNPPTKAHWTYRVFIEGRDPETRQALPDRGLYAALQMNPEDNADNLPAGYLATLDSLPARLRRRFRAGEFGEATPNALWTEETLDKWRVMDGRLPDLQRIVVAVDPSGAGDDDAAEHDEVGIVVAGLGTDGNGYILEDVSLHAGPAAWGRVAASAFDRHAADVIVAETNYGGAMVQFTIRTARPRTPFKMLTASRGKVVRAEPIAALYEQGKVRHVGEFRALESELCAFSTGGYTGDGSPNRADAAIWALTELFPGMVREYHEKVERKPAPAAPRAVAGWMGV